MKWTKIAFLSSLIFFIGCDASNNANTNDAPNNVDQAESQTDNKKSRKDVRIAFYNVENLFDPADDPNKPDEEFTPKGKNKWTIDRYEKKLKQLGKVINTMELPTFIGLCEVENKKVVVDLAANEALADGHYDIAHVESNDYRGIDVALLYNKNRFTVESVENKVLSFPRRITNGQNYTSRDLFHVTGQLDDGETLHIFVNHWPSRRGGLKASEPKRTFVAGKLRQMIDKVQADDKDARIIIMGDFNDETDNKSITKVLKAVAKDSDTPNELVNCFAAQDAKDEGSYNYRGTWNMLDQIILSDNFFDSNSALQYESSTIFKEDFIMYKDSRNGPSPSRTYGGPNYYGGFSDHLPVYIDIDAK